MARRFLFALVLLVVGCGGGGSSIPPAPSPTARLPTSTPSPRATATLPASPTETLPPTRTRSATPSAGLGFTPSPTPTATGAVATASPTTTGTGPTVSPTPRGELVVPASTPVGVIQELPAGPVLGGPPAMPAQYRLTSPPEVTVETFVSGLQVPWSLAFAPDARLFISERPGRIRVVASGTLQEEPWATLPVLASGEGGLMGLTLDPDFADDPWVYVCYTFNAGGLAQNRISRLREVDGHGTDEQILVNAFPGAAAHNGCRLKFGPDGKLYATTGDATARRQAQDLDSLAGKILRLERDGSLPDDNPFASLVWTYGHRNPQGLAFDPVSGALLATEHGPSGEVGIGANDEVNVIVRGNNYGWPATVGAPGLPGYVDPILLYPGRAVPPAGATFYYGAEIPPWQGNLLFASLGGAHLQRIVLDDSRTHVLAIERLFETGPSAGIYGRLRDVIEGPDGALYVATSNRDGRGSPRPGDDKILRLSGASP